MKPIALGLLVSVAAAPLLAEETRELGAHMHGVTQVQIAVENNAVDIMLEAPGMDIVGFEYQATSDADKAAVAGAITALGQADLVARLDLAAGCTLDSTEAALHGEEDYDHDHDHDHDDHAQAESGHSAFEAHYRFSCTSPAALRTISFPFFDTFPNAGEIKAEYVTDAGAGTADITRDAPDLTLD